MKKLSFSIFAGIFLFLAAAGLNADPVLWDQDRPRYPTPSGIFQIPYNGGTHWYLSPLYFNPNRGIPVTSTNISVPASSQTVDDFGGNPASIDYEASGRAQILSDGFKNSIHAEIIHSLNNNASVTDGHQRIQADAFRNFVPKGPEPITVLASLTGSIEWPILNWDFNENQPVDPFGRYWSYRIQGTIRLIPFSVSTGRQVAIIDPIELRNDKVSGSIRFNPIVDPDVYYVLIVSFSVDTYIQNGDPQYGFNLGALPAVLRIGHPDDSPGSLELTARLGLMCLGDFDGDYDVDGKDLLEIVLGNETVNLQDFAFSFGTAQCGN